jgi:hypothetical protein
MSSLHQVARAELEEFVVEGSVAARVALQLVEEIHHDLVQRHVVREDHLAPDVLHVHLRAALLVAERHHRAHVLVRHDDGARMMGSRISSMDEGSGSFDGFSMEVTLPSLVATS